MVKRGFNSMWQLHKIVINRYLSDYYSGYYWGNNPYSSFGLDGKINDAELRDKVIDRIKTIPKSEIHKIEISVKNSIVTLNGDVLTFRERRIIAEEIWRIIGVFKVLNLLKVSDPMTVGPRILPADCSNPLIENDNSN
jgi:BON domain-containing protein